MANSRAVVSIYDEPMWTSIREGRMALQQCDDCGQYRYPPGPNCPHCLSMNYRWRPLTGGGEILSWVVFHRQYFENFPPPYNVVAVRLDEGPIVVTNLVGPEPAESWIGHRVELCYEPDHEGQPINKVRLKRQ